MNDIVIPEGDYIEIVKPICINPFGYYFINIKRGSRLRFMQYVYLHLIRNMARPSK